MISGWVCEICRTALVIFIYFSFLKGFPNAVPALRPYLVHCLAKFLKHIAEHQRWMTQVGDMSLLASVSFLFTL